MSNKLINYIVVAVLGLLLGLTLGGTFSRTKVKTETKTVVVTKKDSMVVYDTVRVIKPVPKDSLITRYETVKIPVTVPAPQKQDKQSYNQVSVTQPSLPEAAVSQQITATSSASDSTEVKIPITQKIYADSLYTAYVSGWHPSLDSIQVYPRKEIVHEYINTTTTVTEKKIKNQRLGIGLMGGYGYGFKSKDLQPFVGIGISWRLY